MWEKLHAVSKAATVGVLIFLHRRPHFSQCKSDAKCSSRHTNDGVTPHVLQAVTVKLRNGKIIFSSSSDGGGSSSNSGILEAPTGLYMLNTGVVMF